MIDRTDGWTALLACLILAIPSAQATTSLEVRATIPDESYFVGEEIPLLVQVRSGDKGLTVPTPTIQGAEVYAIKDNRAEPQAGSDHEFRFRIVAQESGRLIIPAIRVTLREQVARTAPIVLTIRPLPAMGRSASFLGGVGVLRVEAEATPSTLRLGQALEYRLQLRGPGALGSTSPPRLTGIEEGEVRIESLATQTDFGANPPIRTFRWRLRPSQPGSLVVPPQRVASYDPISGSYQTRVSASVTIQVDDVSELDPAAIEFGTEPSNGDEGSRLLAWSSALTVTTIIVFLGYAVAYRWLRRSPRDPRHNLRATAMRLAKGLSDQSGQADPSEAASRVADSLAEYLEASQERPPGALTPAEARDGFAVATSNAKLAEQAGRLLERSDWIRFGMPPTEDTANAESEALLQDAVSLFQGLARRPPRRADP